MDNIGNQPSLSHPLRSCRQDSLLLILDAKTLVILTAFTVLKHLGTTGILLLFSSVLH